MYGFVSFVETTPIVILFVPCPEIIVKLGLVSHIITIDDGSSCPWYSYDFNSQTSIQEFPIIVPPLPNTVFLTAEYASTKP